MVYSKEIRLVDLVREAERELQPSSRYPIDNIKIDDNTFGLLNVERVHARGAM